MIDDLPLPPDGTHSGSSGRPPPPSYPGGGPYSACKEIFFEGKCTCITDHLNASNVILSEVQVWSVSLITWEHDCSSHIGVLQTKTVTNLMNSNLRMINFKIKWKNIGRRIEVSLPAKFL